MSEIMNASRMMQDDRISQLPQPILHCILDRLSPREAARTCTLSKSWRYIESTGPYFTMIEDNFKGSKQEFIDAKERHLQLYHHHKICPQIIFVDLSNPDAESFLFLDKWIPVLVRDWGAQDFSLYLFFDQDEENARFDPPSIIFESKSLRRLTLHSCNLSRDDILHSDTSSLIHLKKLRLSNVCITDEILEKIIFSCPLIKLELSGCVGLRAIRIDKRARYLKRFEWSGSYNVNEPPSLEIDVPSLEKINIHDCSKWYHDKMTYFPHLKSLSLSSVRLSTESVGYFSHNFPCLGSLSLKNCYGFEEFELSSRSIKKFELSSRYTNVPFNRVAIDVPSIVMFKFEGRVPESFSFTTTSEKWKSDITLRTGTLFEETSQGLDKLCQMLKAVSGSEMSLHIGGLNLSTHSVSSFMDNLFFICRPRIIQRSLVDVGPDFRFLFDQLCNQPTKVMCKILGMEKGGFESGRITRGRQWRQDLEKVTYETSDENEEEWHSVLERSWSKFWKALFPKDSKNVKHFMRFRLTWRE
ncbi:Unknown protein [Striga hermonthica]|uniref:F-box domain-containing protein n=1 Tax=Striga hermonthica TaxID=68872 RepID=A0A9N7RKK7_STRHE|nr:Unknown protein [Striga hermonthica]